MIRYIERVVLKIKSNIIDFEIVRNRLFGRLCYILYKISKLAVLVVIYDRMYIHALMYCVHIDYY